MEQKYAVPGDKLGSLENFISGKGTYIKNNMIISALFGKIIILTNNSDNSVSINVISNKDSLDLVPKVGDITICQITKIQINQALCDIIQLGDKKLISPAKAVIRKEDVRELEKDKVILSESFNPGDLVKAVILSLGDSKQLYLSTASENLGVIQKS